MANRNQSISYQNMNFYSSDRRWGVKEIIKIGFLVLISIFIGYLIGLKDYGRVFDKNVSDSHSQRVETNNHDTIRVFKSMVSGENIQHHLK